MSFTESIEELVEKSSDGRVAIHPSWGRTKLSGVAKLLNGFPFASDNFSNEKGFPLIRIRDIVRGKTETFYQGEFDKQFVVERGDLLIGMDGDFNCALWRGEPALLNQRVCKIIPDESKVDKRFLEFALPGYLGLINRHTPSLTVKHLSSGTIKDIPLPFPPLDTQCAIAGKIEELFSDLDAGVAALKRAQANLKRYRAAVLKAAVEGRLTAQWRTERKAKGIGTEPAAKLLERILAERRKKWEAAQLKKYADAGKAPPKEWQSKYPEPAVPLNSDLPALPEGWGWSSLDQLSTALTSGSRDWSQYYDRGSGVFIMAQNVRPWRPDFSYVQLVDPPLINSDRVRSKVEKDDLLVTIVGANTGDFCRVETELNDHFVCQSVALIRPVYTELSAFINTWFNSSENGQRYFDKCMYGQGRPHLGFEELRLAPVAVPPLHEQTEIVAQVEAKLSNIAQAETEIKRSLDRAARLRQAILKRAFEGRLV